MRSCAISSASIECAPSSVKIWLIRDFPEAIPPVSPILSIVSLDELFHHRDTESQRKFKRGHGFARINTDKTSFRVPLRLCDSVVNQGLTPPMTLALNCPGASLPP